MTNLYLKIAFTNNWMYSNLFKKIVNIQLIFLPQFNKCNYYDGCVPNIITLLVLYNLYIYIYSYIDL